jgi:predicted lipoprotein with Yx(FWY)xxD motif
MRRLLAITAVCVPLAFAACGDDDGETPSAGSEPAPAEGSPTVKEGDDRAKKPAPKPARAEKPGIEIKVSASEFGQVLFDGEEQAIYLFDKEESETSECYGECAAAWPPVLTDGDPQAGGGVKANLLDTTERDDGSTQVTYNGHPLYYYVNDPPGQVLCHDVVEFGGLWLVVSPNGDAVS